MTVATAPGKLVIVGDYAVLEGAPSVATSVDVVARAQVDVTHAKNSVFIDLAGGKAYDFVVASGAQLRWTAEQPADRGSIIAAVMDTCHGMAHLRGALPPLRISINTDAFFSHTEDQPVKLGFGSSAAALVALAGALLAELHIPVERESLFNICHAAHRHLQGGKGSGIDVAVATLGGVVSMRKGSRDTYPTAETLSWPTGLFMLPVWSGVSASTRALLARFDGYRLADEDGFEEHRRTLTKLAQQADTAWRGGAVGEILSAVAGYDAALRALDDDAKIGINTPVHEKLRGIVEQHDAVYKTSGAGGGDFGIVLTESSGVLESVTRDLTQAGYTPFAGDVDVQGLNIRRAG